jgi:hypothetical protein
MPGRDLAPDQGSLVRNTELNPHSNPTPNDKWMSVRPDDDAAKPVRGIPSQPNVVDKGKPLNPTDVVEVKSQPTMTVNLSKASMQPDYLRTRGVKKSW